MMPAQFLDLGFIDFKGKINHFFDPQIHDLKKKYEIQDRFQGLTHPAQASREAEIFRSRALG